VLLLLSLCVSLIYILRLVLVVLVVLVRNVFEFIQVRQHFFVFGLGDITLFSFDIINYVERLLIVVVVVLN